MATVPGILLLGDDQLHGGPGAGAGSIAIEADATGTGQTALMEWRDQDVMRIVPSSPITGASTASSLGWFPWWDPWSDYVFQTWATLSATSTTVTLSTIGAAFEEDELVGRVIRVCNPSNVGIQQRRVITANTATAASQTTITVGVAWSTNPVGTQLAVCGRGRWTDYHPAAGYYHPNEFGTVFPYRGGSAEWSEPSGKGVGPDAGLMRLLFDEVYTASPYFQLSKIRQDVTTKTGWETGGDGIAALTAEIAAMATAWTQQGLGANTLEWQWVILDASQADVRSWIATPANSGTYAVDLISAISAIRTAIGNASAKILLPVHDEELNNVDNPGGTVVANRAHRLVAGADANVFTVDMTGLRTQVYEASFWLESANRFHYARHEYWTAYPRRVVDRMKLINAGAPPGVDNGFPVYLLDGDSIAAGPVTETFAASNNSPELSETPRGPNQLIWNAQTGQGEQYNLGDNSLPSGTTMGGTGGPEFALLPLLEQRHPDGFLLIKRASIGSSLAAEFTPYTSGGQAGGVWSSGVADEHWDAREADFEAAVQWVNETLGKQADVRGALIVLGTNDQAVAGGGALFAAELPVFLSDYRSRFATRTVSVGTATKDLPILWVKPQLGTSTGIDDESREIRAALEAQALVDSQLTVLDIDDLDRDDDDNLHPTPEAHINLAERAILAFDALALT